MLYSTNLHLAICQMGPQTPVQIILLWYMIVEMYIAPERVLTDN